MSDELSQIADLFLSTTDSPCPTITVRALLAEHLGNSASAAYKVARHLAKQLGSVGLLELHESATILRLFASSEIKQHREQQKKISDDVENLWRALSELAKTTKLLLVVPDNSASVLLAECREISIVVSPEPEIMVAAYQQLKRLSSSRPEVLGITMVDCSNTAQGQRAAERLRQTAQEFLGLPLRIDAIVLRNVRLRERKLAQIRSVDEQILAKEIRSLG